MPIKCWNIQLFGYLCLIHETLCNKKKLHRETLEISQSYTEKNLTLNSHISLSTMISQLCCLRVTSYILPRKSNAIYSKFQ